MVNALEVGDEVVTNGGTLGRIMSADVNFVGLEVASGVVIQVQRQAVAQLMPQDTIKTKPTPKKKRIAKSDKE